MPSSPKKAKFTLRRLPTFLASLGSDEDDYFDSAIVNALAADAIVQAETHFLEQTSPSLLADMEYYQRDCIPLFD